MRASLEHAGKDLTPAPPRWEGSGRISSVADLCYVLRRTIQACAYAVNSPRPLRHLATFVMFGIVRALLPPSCSVLSARRPGSSLGPPSCPSPLCVTAVSSLYASPMLAPQSRVIQSVHGSYRQKSRHSRRNPGLSRNARPHPNALRLPRRRRNTRRLSRGVSHRLAGIRNRCSRRSKTASPSTPLNAHSD
jgi:hypothetical protein